MGSKDLQRDASQQAIARWENEGGAPNPFARETSSPSEFFTIAGAGKLEAKAGLQQFHRERDAD